MGIEIYKVKDLSDILRMMADYAEEQEDTSGYFQEIVNTGLFHDAIGKVVEDFGDEVNVSTDY